MPIVVRPWVSQRVIRYPPLAERLGDLAAVLEVAADRHRHHEAAGRQADLRAGLGRRIRDGSCVGPRAADARDEGSGHDDRDAGSALM